MQEEGEDQLGTKETYEMMDVMCKDEVGKELNL